MPAGGFEHLRPQIPAHKRRPWFSAVREHHAVGARGLTRHSTGAATAGRLGPARGTRYIFPVRAKPSHRRVPVSSNVRRRSSRVRMLVRGLDPTRQSLKMNAARRCGEFQGRPLSRTLSQDRTEKSRHRFMAASPHLLSVASTVKYSACLWQILWQNGPALQRPWRAREQLRNFRRWRAYGSRKPVLRLSIFLANVIAIRVHSAWLALRFAGSAA